MRLLDLTLPSPEENLACDEVLLELAEEQHAPGILRFWEPRTRFVVVGYSGSISGEVYLERCRRERIPVLRRVTGGGTVVQGPGCLDYALVLPLDAHPDFGTIAGTNRRVMETLGGALAPLLPHALLEWKGETDLTLDGRKIAGSAQRRGTSHLLFHGVILLEFDLPLIGRLLPMPARKPEYRQDRPHVEFVRNLGLPAADVKRAIAGAWGAADGPVELPPVRISALIEARYALSSWNLRR